MTFQTPDSSHEHIAFIGGGNMASAIIGGLLKRGLPAGQIQVIEPFSEQRARLAQQFQVEVSEAPGASLNRAAMVVWAVKPQTFRDAAEQSRAHVGHALHLSVAAGIRSDTIAGWLGTERVVRAMPNTPALIGQGMSALFARPAATAADRQAVERVVQTMGAYLWLDQEAQLDAVTALSGSGPAYVFYFIEAMIQAGTEMGLSREQAHKLAVGTFVGASALAQEATEPPEVLRARVTSKGGTTYAALTSMEQSGIKAQFIQAMQAARQRASEMGDEFGAS
ncbi:pyrroline-5-carboxylate reductase [Polaromonas sp. DSR2-3-2]|uniref:pyrroline-5-carboxylate reductase n=1 Tax=unclassified Polaromonas TaxID=2638319 RepID=UPI003CF5A323